jgi:hypothetical protein
MSPEKEADQKNISLAQVMKWPDLDEQHPVGPLLCLGVTACHCLSKKERTMNQATRIIPAKTKRQKKKQAKRLAAALGLKQTLFPTPILPVRCWDEDGNEFITGDAWPDRQRKNCHLAFESPDPEEGGSRVIVTTGWADAYRQLASLATFDYDREVAKIPF